ncbi:MAG: protein kinase [Kofleriaceae bacterium]|nr:protein kinase [Kofleriaceae bacterium]
MTDADASQIRHGQKIGRFVVEGELGSGGMGVVYMGHDRELDRRVALKVLRGTVDEQQRMRLMREGQAMARVVDENVITVYEVGIEGKLVFLAQELLDGGSLRQWLETKHTQREILAKFTAAGRGLAAAHRAGLVHRDFKPDNVLLGKDGRVRVSDFGLARSLASATDSPTTPYDPNVDALGRTSQDLGKSPMATMTRTGAVMGTPLYMSPEQHNGEPTDERSDQFSFCVALYQALYGDVPFGGKTTVALADAVISGRMQPPPRGASVPSRLRKILLRGLNTKPADRYPSMDALLADLAHDAWRNTRRYALVAGLGLLVAGAVVGGYTLRSRTDQRAVIPSRRTVAVLGFRNLSGDKTIDWVSGAMSELLATQLAGDDVRVTPAEDASRARADLALPNTDSFSPETLAKIRERLGSDAIVIGSYLQSGNELTLVAVVEDLAGARTKRIEVKGSPTELPALTEKAGAQIRDALGLSTLAVAKKSFAVLPNDATAQREFIDGTAALRAYNYRGAKQHLLAAMKIEPDFAPGHVALAQAYAGLFDADASHASAKQALATAKTLGIDQQMLVTAQANELLGNLSEAREHYQRLFAMHSDNIEVGLALARLQPADEAIDTIEALRKLGDDPRYDLAEASAELARPDPPKALELAKKASAAARAKGANLVLAEARALEGEALTLTGELALAQEAYEEAGKRYETAGDQLHRLAVMEALASLAVERGQLDEAFGKYNAIGALRLQAGQEAAASLAWSAEAHTLALRGNLSAAEKRLRDAEKYKGDDPVAVPTIDYVAATIAWGRGDAQSALALADKCTARSQAALMTQCLQLRGEISAELGDVAAARKAFEDGLAVAEKANNVLRTGALQLALAQLELDEAPGDDTVATKVADTALSVQPTAAARGAASLEAQAWIVVARARLVTAESQKALEAMEHVKKQQQLRLEVQRVTTDGLANAALGDSETPLGKIDVVKADADKGGSINLALEARFARAQVQLPSEQGKTELDAVLHDARERGLGRIVKLAEALASPQP